MPIEIVDILDLLRGAANFSFHLTIAWSPHRDHLSVSSIGDRGTNGTKSDLEEALDGPPTPTELSASKTGSQLHFRDQHLYCCAKPLGTDA